jgi:hypothetical protein
MCSTALHYFYPIPKIVLLKIDVMWCYNAIKCFSCIENAIDLVGSKLFR